jgi:hypothetical protein
VWRYEFSARRVYSTDEIEARLRASEQREQAVRARLLEDAFRTLNGDPPVFDQEWSVPSDTTFLLRKALDNGRSQE